MPLDDHEQKILEEIEKQFYEEDPSLANAVRKLDRSGRFGVRVPLIGVIVAVLTILASFTSQTLIALGGFLLLILSATALVHGIRAQRRDESGQGDGEDLGGKWWARPFGRD